MRLFNISSVKDRFSKYWLILFTKKIDKIGKNRKKSENIRNGKKSVNTEKNRKKSETIESIGKYRNKSEKIGNRNLI